MSKKEDYAKISIKSLTYMLLYLSLLKIKFGIIIPCKVFVM